MASQQIDPEIRRARRQRVEELIGKLKAGIAQRGLTGEGSLWDFDIDELARELGGAKGHGGMRGHIRRTLSAPPPRGLGHEDGKALEASLFPEDIESAREVLDAWFTELKQWKLDRTVEKAVAIHFLIRRAREVLPQVEAARTAHAERESREREEAFQARVAEATAAGTLRELHWNDVCELIRDAGHEPDTYGSPSTLYRQANTLGVITDLEVSVAARRIGRGWNYAGD